MQVHPDDDYARRHHNSRGKTEMWHVLRAEPGAQIAAGFREPITPQRLREASLSGEIEDLLAWFDAAPGDTFFIPAGTVHAIGAGLTFARSSSTPTSPTGYMTTDGPRELHLDQAVGGEPSGPSTRPASSLEGEILVSCPYFTTSKLRISNPTKHILLEDHEFLVVIDGSGDTCGTSSDGGRSMVSGSRSTGN